MAHLRHPRLFRRLDSPGGSAGVHLLGSSHYAELPPVLRVFLVDANLGPSLQPS